ncbi:MAG: hypothetical protein RIT00_213 [Actinomycetota bacterium]
MSEMSKNSSSLVGKVLLLSGASRGVGECVARLAVERGAAGLDFVGRDTKTGEKLASELTGLGTKTIFITADLAKPEEPSRIVKQVDKTFGVVHGLLNSAAETSRGSVWNTTPEMFDSMMYETRGSARLGCKYRQRHGLWRRREPYALCNLKRCPAQFD